MKVRRLEAEDIAALAGMVGALADHHGDTPQTGQAVLRRDCLGNTPWLHVWVAEQDNRLLGYIAGQPRVQMQFGRRGVDLHHLYVDSEMRGQGVGRQLVGTLKAWALSEGCEWMSVGTDPANTGARVFYLRLGFHPLEVESVRFLLAL